MGPVDRKGLDILLLSLVKVCVRDTLEDLHAGITPRSKKGDHSDVKAVSPFGDIRWNKVSRIFDEEMKALMIEVANRVFTFLADPVLFTNSFSMPAGGTSLWWIKDFNNGSSCWSPETHPSQMR